MSIASPSPSSSSTFVRPTASICAATRDRQIQNVKLRTRLTVRITWTTGFFRASRPRVELATCRFFLRTTGGGFGVLSAERRGGPPTGGICTTGLHCGLLAQHLYPRAATPAQVIWGNVFRGQFGRNFVNPHVQGTKTQFLGSLVSRAEIGHFLYMEIIKA